MSLKIGFTAETEHEEKCNIEKTPVQEEASFRLRQKDV